MPKHGFKQQISLSGIIVPTAVVFVNIIIILFPRETISASKEGLTLWFNNVLPAVLPFVIGANILTAFGAVSFIGTLLEPLMRPLFNVPGCGGFALAMGLTSGYPMGARTVTELRKSNELSKIEAERLSTFVNNSGPLFVLGAVAAGMLENVAAGYFVLGVHYISALTVGVLFRFYKRSGAVGGTKRCTWRRAYKAMTEARKRNGAYTIGGVLGQSVFAAMETALQIGGFIILFCVIVKAFDIVGIFDVLLNMLRRDGDDAVKGLLVGIVEMTNGCKGIAANGVNKSTVLMTLAVVSWGGLSIHAQSIAFFSKTDINSLVYVASKLAHGTFAVAYGYVLYPLFGKMIESAHFVEASTVGFQSSLLSRALQSLMFFGVALVLLFAGVVFAGLVLYIYNGKRS